MRKCGLGLRLKTKSIIMLKNLLFGKQSEQDKIAAAAELLGISTEELQAKLRGPSTREASLALGVNPSTIAIARQIHAQGITNWSLMKLGINENQLEELQMLNKQKKQKTEEPKYVPKTESLGPFLKSCYAFFVKYKAQHKSSWKHKTEQGHLHELAKIYQEIIGILNQLKDVEDKKELTFDTEDRLTMQRIKLYHKAVVFTFFAYYAATFGEKETVAKPKLEINE